MRTEDLRAPNPEPLFCDYFDLHVRWRGDRPAFAVDDVKLCWAELGRRAYRVANGIAELGLGPGDAIVVLIDNRLEAAEIVLGVIRSGATVVPINLSIADDAIVRQIEDCGAAAVFATAQDAARVDPSIARIAASRRICVGGSISDWTDYGSWCRSKSEEMPRASCQGGELLTIVYSSGTTGVPKGIAHTHLTRTRVMLEIGRALRLSEDSVWIGSLGFYSNAGMLPFLSTLILGGSVVLLRRFDPGEFLAGIQHHRATHSLIVPLMLRALLAHASFGSFDVSSFELICVAGASIEPDTKEAARLRFGCVLLELYGLTEGFATITSSRDGLGKIASVGRPLAGADVKILRDDGSEASVGEPGEIVGYSQSIMVGYLNRPEESAAAFVEDADGRRWLRTGDIGKLDEDGFLYYVGRKKDLIVSGGQNIFPADIEEVALAHPDVAEVAVVGVPHPKWDETPVAVVILRDGAEPTAADLQLWINDRVGLRQRVSAVLFTNAFPVNAMGKVLKRELREKMVADHAALLNSTST